MKFFKFFRKFCYISLNIRKLYSMSRKEIIEFIIVKGVRIKVVLVFVLYYSIYLQMENKLFFLLWKFGFFFIQFVDLVMVFRINIEGYLFMYFKKLYLFVFKIKN